MKATIFLASFLLIITSFAQVPTYVPTTGLVGWWPFNGNANDESGNGNNGTVNGAILTSDRNGFANNAFFFNVNNWSFGSGGDNIYIPYNSSFNFSNYTISAWVKRNSIGSLIDSPNQNLAIIRRFENGASSQTGEVWTLDIGHELSSNCSVLYGYAIQQSPVYQFNCQTTQTIPLNQWCFVTMKFEQNTIFLYINGQLVNSVTNNSFTINTNSNSGISIGISDQANGHWFPFDGAIDDIGIWNRALSNQEITELYNGCQFSINTQPTNQLININNNAQFVIGSSDTSATYQWQSDLGLGFQNVSNAGQYSGATNDTLTISNITTLNNNQQFRCIVNPSSCADTSDIAVLTVNNNVGIIESSPNNLISIFPNPTNDIFSIIGIDQLGKVTGMLLKDLNGKTVKVLDLKATQFKITDLKSGVYFLTISAGEMQEVIKLIKE